MFDPSQRGNLPRLTPVPGHFPLNWAYIPVLSYAMRYVQCALCSGENPEKRNWRFHPLIPWAPSTPSSDWASGKSVWRLTKIGGIRIIERKWNLVKRKSCNLHSSSWYKSWLTKYFCPFFISMTDKIKTHFRRNIVTHEEEFGQSEWTKMKNGHQLVF